VHNNPADLDEYRETMRLTLGPSVGQVLIPDHWTFSLTATETVAVVYSQPGMPDWNQLHINGQFRKIDNKKYLAAREAAVSRVNPQAGSATDIYEHLNVLRTKPRVDMARQLFDLAVR
jgi:hypothetical protein